MAARTGTRIKAVAQAALTAGPDCLRETVERTVQELLEAARPAHRGAARDEHSTGRKGQRNGDKPRTLHTRVSTLTLLVPQARARTFSPPLFARYPRNEQALVWALLGR